jgi:arginine decarboxylase
VGPLEQALHRYQNWERHRFHVPGHGGQIATPFERFNALHPWDLTEAEGMDSLSEPDYGCLAQSQAWLAQQLGVAHSFYLVNGSTVGLLAALLACVPPGRKVLLPRNAHRAVIHGLVLTGAEPVWLMPTWDPVTGLWLSITPQAVQEALAQYPDMAAIVLLSPSYEGLCPDVQAIAALAKPYGATVIVDEAHGALLSLAQPSAAYLAQLAQVHPSAPGFAASAVRAPVDVVVQSLHKSGGSLTQTALAHLPTGSTVTRQAMQAALNVVHTSSPSYLLLLSLEQTTRYWLSDAGSATLQGYYQRVADCRAALMAGLKTFTLVAPNGSQADGWDWTKLVLTSRMPRTEPAEDWATRLEQDRRLAYEATNRWFTLYYPGPFLPEDSYQALIDALIAEEAHLADDSSALPSEPLPVPLPEPLMAMGPREAFMAPATTLATDEAVGRVAKTTHAPCPPGIPVVVPGEVIQPEHLPYLPDTIQVVA